VGITISTDKEFPYILEDKKNSTYIGCDKYLNPPPKTLKYITDINVYTVTNCQQYLKRIIYKFGPGIVYMSIKRYPNQDENPFFFI